MVEAVAGLRSHVLVKCSSPVNGESRDDIVVCMRDAGEGSGEDGKGGQGAKGEGGQEGGKGEAGGATSGQRQGRPRRGG